MEITKAKIYWNFVWNIWSVTMSGLLYSCIKLIQALMNTEFSYLIQYSNIIYKAVNTSDTSFITW